MAHARAGNASRTTQMPTRRPNFTFPPTLDVTRPTRLSRGSVGSIKELDIAECEFPVIGSCGARLVTSPSHDRAGSREPDETRSAGPTSENDRVICSRLAQDPTEQVTI